MSKRPDIKIEKITLWTSTSTYGSKNVEDISAIDTITEALDHSDDIIILDGDAEALVLCSAEDLELMPNQNE